MTEGVGSTMSCFTVSYRMGYKDGIGVGSTMSCFIISHKMGMSCIIASNRIEGVIRTEGVHIYTPILLFVISADGCSYRIAVQVAELQH